MKKIVFLASGNGGNLKFFYLAMKKGFVSATHLTTIADRPCGAVDYSQKNNLDNYIIGYTRSNPIELTEVLDKINPDIIITNWHKIIDEDTVTKYQGKLVNLHYSLLPAFGGLIGIEPIKLAYLQGCKFIGPTCHLVDEGVDTGKILSQAIFTTERPIDEAITLMFRKGCLVLLNGIQQIVGQSALIKYPENADRSYSPPIRFDISLFDETFWTEIKAA